MKGNVEVNKDQKAEVVMKNREKEYAKHTLIAIIVLALVVTSIVLAIKFIKKPPESIQLLNEAGEPLGTYSEGSNIQIPTKKGYATFWIAESGQSFSSLSDALASGEASVKQSFSPISYTVTLYLTGGQLADDKYEHHEASEDKLNLGDYYTRTYTIEDENFDLPAIERTTSTLASKKGNSFYFWSNVNYIGTNYKMDDLKATEVKTISTQEASDIVLYAAWKPVMCTIHVFNVDGTLMFFEEHQESSLLSEEALTTTVLTHEKTPLGYEFVGFCSDSKLNNAFDFEQEISHQTTAIYTKWNALPYTLTFKDTNGDTIKTQTFKTNDEIEFYDYTERLTAGKMFGCWMLDGEAFELTKMPPQNLVLTAHIVNIPYTITWYVDNERTETETYFYGQEPHAPATLNTDKAETDSHTYVFDGWSPALTSVSEDKRYEAQYREVIKKFTYSIEVNNEEVVSPTLVEYGTEIIFPADPASYKTAQYEYTFDKWVIENTNNTPDTVTKDMVIVALFNSTLRSYTVSWEDKNEIEVHSIEVAYGTQIDLNAGRSHVDDSYEAEVSGHNRVFSFKGWSIGNIFQNTNSYTVVGPTVVRAKYEDDSDKSNYVLLDENGEQIAADTYYVGEYEDFYNLIMNIVRTKDSDETYSYGFDGWYYDKAGVETKLTEATKSDLDIPKNATITLKEKFTATYIPYKITWNLNNGEPNVEAIYHYGETLHPQTDLGSTPTKAPTESTVYTFSGWNNTSDVVTKSTTYIAQYTESIRKYTYTFFVDALDEEPTRIKTIDYNDTIVAPLDATKAATAQYTYTFDGWYTDINDANTKFVEGTKIKSDVIYYAKFNATVNRYTYTFYKEDGETVVAQVKADYGTIVNQPTPDPTKASTAQYEYSFSGWETLDGVAYVDAQALVADVSYIATFDETLRSYTYKFYNGSDEFRTGSLTYGSELDVSTIDIPTKAAIANQYTYEFAGWYLDSGFNGNPVVEPVTIQGAISFFAKYNEIPVQHTYKFDTGVGATEVADIVAGYNTDISAPVAPQRDYYIFVGWNTPVPSKMGDADKTFTAQWTPVVYHVEYILNGGSNTSNNTYYTVESQASNLALALDSTKDGYTLQGWKLDDEIITSIPIAHKDLQIEAVFVAKTYTITYKTQKGIPAIDDTTTDVTYDQTYGELATPSKHGYTFEGWYLDSACSDNKRITSSSIVKILSNTNIYAKWSLTPYHVYGYVGNDCVVTFTYDIEHSVNLDAYTNGGEYVFDNWYEEDVNDSSITSFTPITTFGDTTQGDINVYAIVKPTALTIVGNTVTAYTGSASHVIIPRVWNGIEITAIADNVFAKNNDIVTVDTTFITSIGDSAFKRCKNLENVDLSNAETIGNDAFLGSEKITTIDLTSATSIGEDAFYGCKITTIHYNGTKEDFETLVANCDNLSWKLVD